MRDRAIQEHDRRYPIRLMCRARAWRSKYLVPAERVIRVLE
jgi:hypothetical protein